VFGPYVYHYHTTVTTRNLPWLTGLEWVRQDLGRLRYGLFPEFIQSASVYAYVSKRWFSGIDGDQGAYLKITGRPSLRIPRGVRGQGFRSTIMAWLAIITRIGSQ